MKIKLKTFAEAQSEARAQDKKFYRLSVLKNIQGGLQRMYTGLLPLEEAAKAYESLESEYGAVVAEEVRYHQWINNISKEAFKKLSN